MKHLFFFFTALMMTQSSFAMNDQCRKSLTGILGYFDIYKLVSYKTKSGQNQMAMTVRYTSTGYNYGRVECLIVRQGCTSIEASYPAKRGLNRCTFIQQHGSEPAY